ncbi:hypothetical protein PG996_015601 [Apiospora saccharicola]|uniref:Uncharacterized protein n=1 Tax=Apiospora saccharicola TaxID=335842 RepID=A0ABR1TLN4_9PEZI
MDAKNKGPESSSAARAVAQPQRSSINPFKEVFEVSMKTLEICEKDFENRQMEWRDCDDKDLAAAEAKLAASRGRLKESADDAAKVVQGAKGYAGIREESAELMRAVRRVRQQHLKE